MKKETKKIFVEVADTPIKRERGLMHRKRLGQNEGMLFRFPNKSRLSFWMQNTYIPLDIAFLEDDGKILQISEMMPLSTRSVGCDQKSRLALEVNKGWFKANGINPGDYIGNIDINNHKVKKAQIDPLMMDEDPNQKMDEGILTPVEDPMQNQQNAQNQMLQQNQPPAIDPNAQQTPSPKVTLERTVRQKIEDADYRKLPLTIQYTTEDGNTLPPRKLLPIPHEGYPIVSSKNGYVVKGIDASPDLNLGGMEIEGGTIKSFLIDNIITLEVEEPVQPQQNNQKPMKQEKELPKKEEKPKVENKAP